MVTTGESAITQLEAGIRLEEEPSLSSHWSERHSDFSCEAGVFTGIRGFGNLTPRTWRHRIAHRVMQVRLRRTMVHFEAFPHLMKRGSEVASKQNRTLDLDLLRQVASLSVIEQYSKPTSDPTVLVIGDGFGAFSSLVLQHRPKSRIVLVNLDKTLLVDLVFIKMVLGNQFDAVTRLVSSHAEIDEALAAPGVRLLALRARSASLVEHVPADWAVNIVSMGEMLLSDINAYFGAIRRIAARRELLFYNCNRIAKEHPDGSVIRFADYPWESSDMFLFDELCPWHQEYYTLRPPRYLPYDGPIRHALVRIASSPQV